MKVSSKHVTDKDLPEWQSHLMVEMPEAGLTFDFRGYFNVKGISLMGETIVHDEKRSKWLIFSVSVPNIGQFMLDLIEKGFTGNIRGIDAKDKKE
ncbi:MAG: hypothetical protein FJY85_06480 [Deltaproteobacteria bacterium]|nr:hypothetical protein [Deltaproteobacteria bacterium]